MKYETHEILRLLRGTHSNGLLTLLDVVVVVRFAFLC